MWSWRSIGRRHLSGWRTRLVVLAGLAGFVGGVYVLVVLGGGAVIGRTDSPSPLLCVVATTVVALAFAPMRSALEAAATSWGLATAPSPGDVLSRFSATVTGGYATEELPARMAMLLAQGTGAQWAQVWLTVGDQLRLAASWPARSAASQELPDQDDDPSGGRRTAAVRHHGRLLGVLRLQEHPGLRLTPIEERLFDGLAGQAGLVLRQVALRAELADRYDDLAARAAQLDASRDRLIEAQDAERRRLERDIHDGAQQHLVALAVNLRLAQTLSARSPGRAAAVLAEQSIAAGAAIGTISQLARGIYPRVLADEGLLPAITAAAVSSPIAVTVEISRAGRLPASAEAALYFCCMEAIQNAAKHSGGQRVTVRLAEGPLEWRLTIADDGAGFDPAAVRSAGSGAGLANMDDRLDAVGGTIAVDSGQQWGTMVTALVPRDETGWPQTGSGISNGRVG